VLAVGDCFDADGFAPGTTIGRAGIHLVDCAEPHQHQVYAVVRDPEPLDAPFPGDRRLTGFADDACLDAFPTAFGVDYKESDLDFATVTPDEAAWDSGERALVCVVHHADFQLLTDTQLPPTSTSTSLTSESS
jgi:hypothetical protein